MFKNKFRFFFIFVVNIILVCVVFLLFDLYVFKKEFDMYAPNCYYKYFLNEYKNFVLRDISVKAIENMIIYGKDLKYHDVLNKDKNKEGILLFGCSFVYGHKIPQSKALYRVLANYTDLPIYDRSFHGWGVNQMLFQLKSDDFYKIVPKPKFIIFTYFNDHVNRLYRPNLPTIKQYHGSNYIFNEKDNKLVLKKNSPFAERFVSLAKFYYPNPDKFNFEQKRQFLLNHFIEAKYEIDKHWSDTKFIILVYFSDDIFESIKEDLKKNNIQIIYRENLVHFNKPDERYYLSKKDNHPSDKAWEAIVPKLIQHLK